MPGAGPGVGDRALSGDGAPIWDTGNFWRWTVLTAAELNCPRAFNARNHTHKTVKTVNRMLSTFYSEKITFGTF